MGWQQRPSTAIHVYRWYTFLLFFSVFLLLYFCMMIALIIINHWIVLWFKLYIQLFFFVLLYFWLCGHRFTPLRHLSAVNAVVAVVIWFITDPNIDKVVNDFDELLKNWDRFLFHVDFFLSKYIIYSFNIKFHFIYIFSPPAVSLAQTIRETIL